MFLTQDANDSSGDEDEHPGTTYKTMCIIFLISCNQVLKSYELLRHSFNFVDDGSQSTNLFERINVYERLKKSPGSYSDSGLGRSSADHSDTKSLVSEYTEVHCCIYI